MHGVNLDLLRTLPHHPDGRAKDPHAHHRAQHLARLEEERLARGRTLIDRILGLMSRAPTGQRVVSNPCP